MFLWGECRAGHNVGCDFNPSVCQCSVPRISGSSGSVPGDVESVFFNKRCLIYWILLIKTTYYARQWIHQVCLWQCVSVQIAHRSSPRFEMFQRRKGTDVTQVRWSLGNTRVCLCLCVDCCCPSPWEHRACKVIGCQWKACYPLWMSLLSLSSWNTLSSSPWAGASNKFTDKRVPHIDTRFLTHTYI